VHETRPDLLKAAVGSAAALLLSSGRLGAQPAPLIECAIPSSGERLPVIGIGTARRWEQATTPAEMAPLRDVLRQFAERGGKVIDTAPSYGNAEALVGRRRGAGGGHPGDRNLVSPIADPAHRPHRRPQPARYHDPAPDAARAQAGGPHPLRGYDDFVSAAVS
jgi:hypothetical protein